MGRGHSPIVARFIYHTDLSMVLYNANRLKNTHIGIHQRFPNIIEQRRKKLYPVQKEAKRSGQQTVLVHDQLFINGVHHQCNDNMDELHQANDTRNKSRPAYRDALLMTTPKESQRRKQDSGTERHRSMILVRLIIHMTAYENNSPI